ncbi:hypothetical protein ACWCQK_40225 [Streptomyces sp. NPDC002306]
MVVVDGAHDDVEALREDIADVFGELVVDGVSPSADASPIATDGGRGSRRTGSNRSTSRR